MSAVSVESQLKQQKLPVGNYLYVVFSSTPCKVGSLIRFATRNYYNHVAISTEEDLRTLYSFARRYRNTPLYAGFEQETRMRYCYGQRVANVKVCALPISSEKETEIKAILEKMHRSSDKYVYNLLSAILHPMGMRLRLPNSYTCVEFVTDFLHDSQACQGIDPAKNYTIADLECVLDQYVVYTGEFPHPETMCKVKDNFDLHQGICAAFWLTMLSNLQMLGLLFKYRAL